MATIQKKKCRGYTYWQIVESRRVNGKPRPIVLAHLGTAESLLQRLQAGNGKPLKAKVMEFGALAALWQVAQELDVVGTIDRHVGKRQQGLTCGQYMLLAALNRCVGATSKSGLYDWYRQTVLQRLLPTSKSSLTSQRFWDHMGYLDAETITAIEEDLARRVIDTQGLDLRTLLFDATNFDTFIDTQTACELAQRGHAKSKRSDLRLVGLALLVSADFHVPLLSHAYPGNQNDSVTFASITESLVARYRQFAGACDHVTVIFDGGNVSCENLERLDESPYHFITSLTLTHHKDLMAVPLSRFSDFEEERLAGTTAYRTTKDIWGEKRTVVVTRSENLLRGQLAGIATALHKKRAALDELRTKLRRSQAPGARGKGYTRESLAKHLAKLTSGQYVSQILKAEIRTVNGQLDFRYATDRRAFEKLKRQRLGKRILCTDNHEWTTAEIVLGSRAQHHVETAFRQMKDPHWVSFSPMFHWTDDKMRAHVFYCVLALMLASLLHRKVVQAGMQLSLKVLLEELTAVKEVINIYSPEGKTRAGRPRAEYVLTERSPRQEQMCELFDLHALAHD